MKRPIIVFASLVVMIMACQTITGGAPEESEEAPTSVVEEETTEVQPTAAPTSEPTRTREPEATLAPKPQVGVEVVQVASEKSLGDLHMFVLVKNTGNVEANNLDLSYTIKDAGGAEVFAETRACIFIMMLRPGVTAPCLVYLTKDRAEIPEDYQVEVGASAEQASSFSVDHAYWDVEVISSEGRKTGDGGYEILGEVKNAGEFDAEYINIATTLFDAEGKVVSVGYFNPEYTPLPAGESSPFRGYFIRPDIIGGGKAVDHFELLLEGTKGEKASAPQGTPTGEAPFELVDLNYAVDYAGNLVVFGLVENKAPFALESINVSLTFRDKDGVVVGHASGGTLIEVVEPGEIVPFEILFTEAPAREIEDIQAAIEAKPKSGLTSTTRELEILESEGEGFFFFFFFFFGQIKNTSDGDLGGVIIAAALFDKQGKLIGTGTGFIEEDTLDRGKTADFEITVTNMAEGEPDRFELFAEGWFE